MTKEELAAQLDGRQYGNEMTRDEAAQAAASGLLVVFGYSDDCVEFRGVFKDETYACRSTCIRVMADGLQPTPDDDDIATIRKFGLALPPPLLLVTAEFTRDGWTFTTDAPHAVFHVVEDGETYGQGLVIEMPAPSESAAKEHAR